eukprot:11938964-Alexandrium_andersonii.AAC.1
MATSGTTCRSSTEPQPTGHAGSCLMVARRAGQWAAAVALLAQLPGAESRFSADVALCNTRARACPPQ